MHEKKTNVGPFSIKDLKDCLVLLRAHKIGEKETIDAPYIAKLLAKDRGFWFTATTDIRKIKRFVSEIDRLGAEAEINSKSENSRVVYTYRGQKWREYRREKERIASLFRCKDG